MVEAIQSGRKCQTRRIITPLPTYIESSGRWRWPLPKKALHPGCCTEVVSASREWHEYLPDGCSPYGRPGDLLWVREEHRIWTEQKPQDQCPTFHCEYKEGTVISKYAKDLPLDTVQRLGLRKTLGKWQRARFLPRHFARTYLRITDIQVERLQDISEEDAYSEGIEVDVFDQTIGTKNYLDGSWFVGWGDEPIEGIGRKSFRTLWEKINGPGSWEASPWVWKIVFEKVNQ